MKADGDRPALRASSTGLGVRPGVDVIVDHDGYVRGDCGLSVTPEHPDLMPIPTLKARSHGGESPHPLWAIESDALPDDLVFVRDRPDHGVIAPNSPMSAEAFADAIAATRDLWVLQP